MELRGLLLSFLNKIGVCSASCKGGIMPWRREAGLACSFCIFLLSLGAVRAADTPPLRASVHDGDSHAVGQEEVRIENVGSYFTSNSGEFEFRAPQLPGPDSAVRFRVRNWVIVKPCELSNGRTYLPATGSVEIKVYKLADDRLITVAHGALLAKCLVEEMASRFEPKPGSAAHSQNWVTPYYSGSEQPARKQLMHGVMRSVSWQGSSREGRASEYPLGRIDFIAMKSKSLGFSPEGLASALEEWAKSPGDSYHRGLGALYEGRYAEAAALIAESMGSSEPAPIGHYVSLARAEYEQLHFEKAKSALLRALELHPGDAIVRADLELVSEAITKSASDQPGTPPTEVQPANRPGSPTSSSPASPATLVADVLAAMVVAFFSLYYGYKGLVRVLKQSEAVTEKLPSAEPISTPESRRMDNRQALVAAEILLQVHSLFRMVGVRPPPEVDSMIHRVRCSAGRETAGSGV